MRNTAEEKVLSLYHQASGRTSGDGGGGGGAAAVTAAAGSSRAHAAAAAAAAAGGGEDGGGGGAPDSSGQLRNEFFKSLTKVRRVAVPGEATRGARRRAELRVKRLLLRAALLLRQVPLANLQEYEDDLE